MTTYEILPDTTRVWIYQSSKPFDKKDIPQIRHYLLQFADSWVSHNRQLRAFAEIYHDQFIVLMVDESQAGASGCSIDSSVRFIKELEGAYQVNLFDRMTFAYKEGDAIKTASKFDFAALYREGKINDGTLVFDNLVKNKGEFDNHWIKPLGESWHKRMV